MTTPPTILDIIKAHKEVISLLLQIEQATINIDEATPYLDESRQHLSYYASVAPHYEKILNDNTNKRDDLIEEYKSLSWQTFNLQLPHYPLRNYGIPF